MAQPQDFIDAYRALAAKVYAARRDKNNQFSSGMAKVEEVAIAYEMNTIFSSLTTEFINAIDPKKFNKVALESFSEPVLKSASLSLLSDRKATLKKYIEDNKIELSTEDHDLMNYSITSNDSERRDELLAKFDAIAQKVGLKGEYLEKYENVIARPNDTLLVDKADEISTAIAQNASQETLDKFTKMTTEIKMFKDMDPKEYTVPVGDTNIENLINDPNTSPEVLDALNYVKENIRYASVNNEKSKAYSYMLTNRNQEMMSQITKVTRSYAHNFEVNNPEYAGIFTPTMTGAFRVDPERQAGYDKLYNLPFALSDKTKDTMRTIMHKIDEMGVINANNINAAEEGDPKRYAMAKVGIAMTRIHNAINQGNTQDLPKLVEEYKTAKAETDELIKLCDENFSQGQLLYGANVDVARNDLMPIEYRKNGNSVSQVSALMNYVKLCKMNNVPIDKFIEDPKKYLHQFRNNLYDKYDVNKVARGKGPAALLFFMENKPSSLASNNDYKTLALIMRGEEGMKGFDPENTIFNTGNIEFMNQICFQNFAAFSDIKYLENNADKTVRNMLIFDDRTAQEYAADPNVKYDFNEMKEYGELDADKYIAENDINLAALTQKVTDFYIDYAKDRAKIGLPPSEKVVNGIKSLSTKIAELKPELAQTNEFKSFKKVTDSLKTNLSARAFSKLAGTSETPVTNAVKYASLISITNQRNQYKRMSGLTRFASWLPFVNNEATKLRHSINASVNFLKDNGVSQETIDDGCTEKRISEKRENGKLVFETEVDYNYTKAQDIKIYDVSQVKEEKELGEILLESLKDKEPVKEEKLEVSNDNNVKVEENDAPEVNN